MKKYVFLLLLFANTLVFSQYDDIEKSKKLGLISYLTYIKNTSENKMLSLEENVKDEKDKNRIKSEYLKLKLLNDLFINQLCSDMVEKNSIGRYRKLNALVKGKLDENDSTKKISKYKPLLSEIEKTYNYFIDLPKNKVEIAGVQEVFTLLGINPYNIYKDIKATKEKKIATLVSYIKEQSLAPLTKKEGDE